MDNIILPIQAEATLKRYGTLTPYNCNMCKKRMEECLLYELDFEVFVLNEFYK